jgi:hypothetical protein
MEPGAGSRPEALRDFGRRAAETMPARLIVAAAFFNATLWERRNRA